MQECPEAMVAMPTGDVRLFLSTYNRISYYILGVVFNFYKSYFCPRYSFWALAEFD